MTRRAELAAYGVLALALAVLLWVRVRDVDGWYLDEWLYVHAGQWLTGHWPWEAIPHWTRGPQRLYPLLLGVPYALGGTSTAFSAAHVVNVLLMASAVAPAALLARRLIEHPGLRVLAVTLGVALPWLMVAGHLLAESLAFPLFLWACVAILRVAERPTWRAQLLAVTAICLLTLARVNLGVMFAGLAATVIAAEVARRPRTPLRDYWPLLIAFALIAAAAVHLLAGGESTLGDYGRTASAAGIRDRLFGDLSGTTRESALTFLRSLVTGAFVVPFALGTGAALAAACGRLGRQRVGAGVLSLVTLPLVIGSVVLAGSAQEERYVFYAATLIALFAVAAVEHVRALRLGVIAGGVLTLWALLDGPGMPAVTSFDFFHAPAGAFWTRVLETRGNAELWFALALAAAVVLVLLGARRLLVAGLCAAAALQAVALEYSFGQELHGTVDVAGGIATGDRLTYLDASLGDPAAIQPGPTSPQSPLSGAEQPEMWSKDIDAVLALDFAGAGVPAAPGMDVIHVTVGADGLARTDRPLPGWLVASRDDPRVQFDAALRRTSPKSGYAVFQLQGQRARWTAEGIGADGVVPTDRPATLTSAAPAVRLTFAAAEQPVRVSLGERRLKLAAGVTRSVTLRGRRWTLRADAAVRLVAARLET
jgi:hypothetical protein